MFPYYLAIGMTYEQFWLKDCRLVQAYRRAHELQNRQRNEEMWLQGYYLYAAVGAQLATAFSKKGEEPVSYLAEPLPLTQEDVEAQRLREEKRRMERIKARFIAAAGRVQIAEPSAEKEVRAPSV